MSTPAVLSLANDLGLLVDQNKPPVLGVAVFRPFLTVTGLTLLVMDETIEIYEYAGHMEMERDLRALGLEAQFWTHGGDQSPYVFRKDRILVLYTGNHRQMLTWVTRVLGPALLKP